MISPRTHHLNAINIAHNVRLYDSVNLYNQYKHITTTQEFRYKILAAIDMSNSIKFAPHETPCMYIN